MRTRTTAALAALLLALGAQGLHSQISGTRAPRGEGPAGQPRVGARSAMGSPLDLRIGQILDRRHTLGLTDAQMESLQALQAEAHARLQPMREEMASVREGLRDGSLTRAGARERLAQVRDGWAQARQGLADRLEQTLEPRQRALLRSAAMGREGRAAARAGQQRPARPMAGARRPGPRDGEARVAPPGGRRRPGGGGAGR